MKFYWQTTNVLCIIAADFMLPFDSKYNDQAK